MAEVLSGVLRGVVDGLEAAGRTWWLGLPAAIVTGLLFALLTAR